MATDLKKVIRDNVRTLLALAPTDKGIAALQSQDWELCYVSIVGRPEYRQAANQVIGERQLDCNQHMAMVQARMAADQNAAARSQAQTALGLQMMQAAQPKPAPPMNLPVNCRSYWRGTYWQTVCD